MDLHTFLIINKHGDSVGVWLVNLFNIFSHKQVLIPIHRSCDLTNKMAGSEEVKTIML